MTQQIPDICQFDGRKYQIDAWYGDTDCIPSSEALGFTTESEHTANWEGRIDHFQVCGDKLYLFKLEVNLSEGSKDYLPQGARKEVLLRYEQFTDFSGKPTELREYRHEFIVFEDLVIPFSGSMHLSTYLDDWERPQDADEPPIEEVILHFKNGVLQELEEA
ncbi:MULTISPECIES: hypothetical protein [Deefgea]|uniref:Uncharacterized protein n=1 Tax=Deefgea chitinilytica TaxID=570276 RepID=A0ABS2CDM6_9NEIS|nr:MULTISPECIES: hypothetical protein [Deefgea]MBM5572269.1 hypothetical protein [Deefgea chitinilytica]MBM9889505.1 hypothetical protein [Deefgea sp. CFH1-16]